MKKNNNSIFLSSEKDESVKRNPSEIGSIVKEYPRIKSEEIYRYICHNTSLKKWQVKECFNCYRDMLIGILGSKYTDNDITISLPNVGDFYFCKVNGRKKGTVYKMPKNLKNEIVTLVAKGTSWYKLKFKVYPKINNILKEKTFETEE